MATIEPAGLGARSARVPIAWRLAAQLVSVLASLGVLIPVYFLTESLFDRRIAFIGAGVLAFLPRLAEVGHETLADSLGLFATFMALWLAAKRSAFDEATDATAIGSGLFAGLGYLARGQGHPRASGHRADLGSSIACAPAGRSRLTGTWPRLVLMLLIPALAVCGYAAIKGEISEKVGVPTGLGAWGHRTILVRPVPQQVPRGLDDPRWDFSPKEESERVVIRGTGQAFQRILGRWWEELAWFFAVMTAWGWTRRSSIRRADPTLRWKRGCPSPALVPTENSANLPRPRLEPGLVGLLLGLFALVYTLALVRHSTSLGYLSWRHVLPLVVASIPWAAGGTLRSAAGGSANCCA